MSAKLLLGTKRAEQIIEGVKAEIKTLFEKTGRRPHLKVLVVSSDKASEAYIKRQRIACEQAGIEYSLERLPDCANTDEILKHIEVLNRLDAITGIMLQKPVPDCIDARCAQTAITPKKDVEGVSPANLGKLISARADIIPCTAAAVIELLKDASVEVSGKEVTIIGHSEIVGKPLALLLLARFATVTVCHIETQDISKHTKSADIVISATGKAHLIKAEMLKNGVVVVDVGYSKLSDAKANGADKTKTKIVGDVDFENVKKIASLITPVPGGVGPLTTAMLIKNTLIAFKKQIS